MQRRVFLQGTVGMAALLSRSAHSVAVSAAPSIKVEERRVISRQPNHYHGWPTLTQRKNGQLLLVSSAGRESHICPFGRVELMASKDQGSSWSWPRVLLDGPIDDRDAGILETQQGTLLATTFSSVAYVPILEKGRQIQPGKTGAWEPERLARWEAAHGRIGKEQRQQALGVWMTRSTDGGLTWSGRYRCLVNSPHGPIQLADGRLLYAGKGLWTEAAKVGVCVSADDGVTWKWLAEIKPREGDSHHKYHELHAVETEKGRLIAHIRNHNSKHAGETLQSESEDGGRSWSVPHSIGVWGLPSHLLRLRDGRLLMSYGHRRPPFGNHVRISEDEGRSWSAPTSLSTDGIGHDLGYPSSVELPDGSLVTVWYERLKSSPRAVLRQARWHLQ